MRESLKRLFEFCRDYDFVGTVETAVDKGGVVIQVAIATGEGRRPHKRSNEIHLDTIDSVKDGVDLVAITERRLVDSLIATVEKELDLNQPAD